MSAAELFRLDGFNILVTGASSGIGRAVAFACAHAGAKLIITGRDEQRLKEVVVGMPGTGHQMFCVDLKKHDQLFHLADNCPQLHGVVHSAGVHGVAPMRLVQFSMLEQVFSINYYAPVILTQRLLIRKKISSGGSILFISSIAAKTGKHGMGPYSGTKAALLGTMRPLALEVAKHGIRVNSLCPGIVRTPLFTGQEDWLNEEVVSSYPLGLGEPEDIANSAVFFLSQASSKITGVDFSIDGGVVFT